MTKQKTTKPLNSRRRVLAGLAGTAGVAALLRGFPALAQAKSEVGTVVLAPQFGLSYLPLHVMRAHKLVEKHLAKNGLPTTKVEWAQTTGGASANDGLLSGTMHVVSGGVGPLLTIWDKTKGNADVKGIGCLDATALYLTTINPKIKTLRDFGDSDRIALPAVKISIQAVTLQMASEKEFGQGHHTQLDRLTVSMSHPDGLAAMLSGKSEIDAHFTSPPFQFQELADKRVHRVLSSFDVLGGPATFNACYTTTKFHAESPRSYRSVYDALAEAHDFIDKSRAEAIKIYIEAEHSKLQPDFIVSMMARDDVKHTIVPLNTVKYAQFMEKVGSLKHKPESWKDYFFPELYGVQGS